MFFRYRPSEAGGAGGREAPGSSGQEEREEGETPHWHFSARWRGKRPDVITNVAENSPAVTQKIFCFTASSWFYSKKPVHLSISAATYMC